MIKRKFRILRFIFKQKSKYLKQFFKKYRQDAPLNKQLVFINHSFHAKTQSHRFFLDFIRQSFNVIEIQDDSWNGKPFPDLSFIDAGFDAVIFWQTMPPITILKSIHNSNIILIPMFDQSGQLDFDYWRQYKDCKFICFSNKLHVKLKKWGFNTIYAQYFPTPQKFVKGDSNRLFFWQRIAKINFNTVKALLGRSFQVHIHNAVDPGNDFVKPTKEDEELYQIEYSRWLEKKSKIDEILKKCALYFAPRDVEGIGLSFLEAMAMGKAVIAPNNPTMNEYIIHNKTGYLYDLNNPKAISLDNIEEIQKNTYTYMQAGYDHWIKTQSLILVYITK